MVETKGDRQNDRSDQVIMSWPSCKSEFATIFTGQIDVLPAKPNFLIVCTIEILSICNICMSVFQC